VRELLAPWGRADVTGSLGGGHRNTVLDQLRARVFTALLLGQPIPHHLGGVTCPCNLAPSCKR